VEPSALGAPILLHPNAWTEAVAILERPIVGVHRVEVVEYRRAPAAADVSALLVRVCLGASLLCTAHEMRLGLTWDGRPASSFAADAKRGGALAEGYRAMGGAPAEVALTVRLTDVRFSGEPRRFLVTALVIEDIEDIESTRPRSFA